MDVIGKQTDGICGEREAGRDVQPGIMQDPSGFWIEEYGCPVECHDGEEIGGTGDQDSAVFWHILYDHGGLGTHPTDLFYILHGFGELGTLPTDFWWVGNPPYSSTAQTSPTARGNARAGGPRPRAAFPGGRRLRRVRHARG